MKKNIYLYNTLSRKKELFAARGAEVGLYCCGPTVYDYPHIGNLRTYIFEDILKRVLLSVGYKVKHIVNITDVGHLTSDADTGLDKMEQGAKREGKTVWDIADYYTHVFMQNIFDLNIMEPTLWPKATDHIPEMIRLIVQLVNNGVTYQTGDGIYFDTTKFSQYSDFARLDPDSLRAGVRVGMGEKKHPTDFALWKFSPKNTQRMMEWESPWGVGFPGWHIECSAMALKYLSQPIDIHCGGTDHIRIHHSNEIAQVEAATMKTFVRFWLHGEFLVLGTEKMSKSKENFFTLESLKKGGISPLAFRFFCYSAHYRSPLSFSFEGLQNATQSLNNLKRLVLQETQNVDKQSVSAQRTESILESFIEALNDDLNMPRAIAAIWDIVRKKTITAQEKRDSIQKADQILALDLLTPEPEKIIVQNQNFIDSNVRIVSEKPCSQELQRQIADLIVERKSARDHKNFEKADQIRDRLKDIGVILKDLPDGITECFVTVQVDSQE